MDRRISVSELRRRPMHAIRQALESVEGIVITFRGSPMAVIRGLGASREPAPDPEADPGSVQMDGAYSAPYGAVDCWAGDWTAESADPQPAGAEAALDSASWGLWEGLTEAQRLGLVRAIQEKNGGCELAGG